jgi:hypothetical protein
MEDDGAGAGGWIGDMKSSQCSMWTTGATSITTSTDCHIGKIVL